MNAFWMTMAAYGLILAFGLALLGYCAWHDWRDR